MWVMMMVTAAAAMTPLPAQGQMCHRTASLQPPTQPAPAYLSAATALTDPSLVRPLVGYPVLAPFFLPSVAVQHLGRPSWPDQSYEH